MRIAAIMPCRGRAEQTLMNVRRLLATAGLEHGRDWWLYLVGGEDEASLILHIVNAIAKETGQSITIATSARPQESYWQALRLVTDVTDYPYLVNLANDLLPGRYWLARAVAAYQATFGNGDGMIGFNDGIHEVEHSPHFLISRGLLGRYGGWPIWYGHNFGDTELIARATEEGCYAKAPWAVLYHDHWLTGAARDMIYAEGDAQAEADQRLFEQRRRAGWPRVSP